MFGMRWRVFRILGIPIHVDATWLIILALVTLTLGDLFPALLREYFPEAEPNLTAWHYRGLGLLTALAFFGCLLLHELGHAIVARARGIPVRGITLFLFGGVAEMGEEPSAPLTEFLMAIAGPLVSAILACLLALAAWLSVQADWPPVLVIVLGYLAGINALVLVFNLLPAFPLDGGRVLRALLWALLGNLRRATRWAAGVGQGFGWLLIVWGALQFFAGNRIGGV
jgi:Zn-dependent protease